jgi:hypothetical protein
MKTGEIYGRMTFRCGDKLYGARPILQVSEKIQKGVHSSGDDGSGLAAAVTLFDFKYPNF